MSPSQAKKSEILLFSGSVKNRRNGIPILVPVFSSLNEFKRTYTFFRTVKERLLDSKNKEGSLLKERLEAVYFLESLPTNHRDLNQLQAEMDTLSPQLGDFLNNVILDLEENIDISNISSIDWICYFRNEDFGLSPITRDVDPEESNWSILIQLFLEYYAKVCSKEYFPEHKQTSVFKKPGSSIGTEVKERFSTTFERLFNKSAAYRENMPSFVTLGERLKKFTKLKDLEKLCESRGCPGLAPWAKDTFKDLFETQASANRDTSRIKKHIKVHVSQIQLSYIVSKYSSQQSHLHLA